MNQLEKDLQTQLENIKRKYGKSLDQLHDIINKSGLEKHGQIRSMLKESLGMGHGDANAVTSLYLKPPAEEKADSDPLKEIYFGKKQALRPIHDLLMEHISEFGEFEIAPKKTYISLRRKKQFAMIGPATNTRVEVGINSKTLAGNEKLLEQKPGGMCQFKVKLTEKSQVDPELIAWIRTAYDSAG